VDAQQAIDDSASIKSKLPGTKFITIGGGDSSGRWTSAAVQKVTSYCKSKKFSGYSGIAYDIEEGDSGLSSVFLSSFSACKSAGYQVLVTVSNSAPYGISDAKTLMTAFLKDTNIEYVSPQLYQTGNEGSNLYDTNANVPWSAYVGAKPKIVPSIVKASYYSSAKSYFSSKGITLSGYIQWNQDVTGSAAAVSQNSNTFSEASPVDPMALSGTQIGLIVGACVLLGIIIVAIVVIVSLRKKYDPIQERI